MITTTEMTNLFHKYLQELIEKNTERAVQVKCQEPEIIRFIHSQKLIEKNTERAVQVKCQEPEIIRFMKWLAKEGFLCQKP